MRGLPTGSWLVLLAAAAATAQEPAPAAPPVQLEYAFERLDGKTAVYEVETEQVVGQELHGLPAGRERRSETLSGEARTRVMERQEWRFAAGEAGGGRITIRTGQVAVVLEENGAKPRTYTSDHPQRAPERLRPLLGQAGQEVSLGLARNGAVTDLEGVPETAREGYRRTLLELPPEPLRPGQGWDRLESRPMPPLGTITYHFHYALAPPDPAQPGRRRLEVSIRAELEADPAQSFRAEVSGQEGRGWLLLSPDGLLLESLLESRLELTIKSARGTQVQRLRQRTRQVLKTS